MTQKIQIANVSVVSVVYPFLHDVCLIFLETASEICDTSRVNLTVVFVSDCGKVMANVGGVMSLLESVNGYGGDICRWLARHIYP